MVRERVPRTQECLLRSSGWEDKESSEDFLRNIEKPRRSTRTSTIISTLDLRVTCSRTRTFWSNPSTRWSKRRSEKSNLKNKEKPERSRLVRRNPRETTERLSPWVSLRKLQRRNEHSLPRWKVNGMSHLIFFQLKVESLLYPWKMFDGRDMGACKHSCQPFHDDCGTFCLTID